MLSENQENALSEDAAMIICFHFAGFNLQLVLWVSTEIRLVNFNLKLVSKYWMN